VLITEDQVTPQNMANKSSDAPYWQCPYTTKPPKIGQLSQYKYTQTTCFLV